MSEVRFQSSPLTSYPSWKGMTAGPGPASSTALLEHVPMDTARCEASGSPGQMLDQGVDAPSSPAASSSVVQMQSDAASAITGGGSFDARLASEQSARGVQSVGEIGANWGKTGGAFDVSGKAGGAVANALAIPQGIANTRQAWEEGNGAGVVRHGTGTLSNGLQVASNLGSIPLNIVKGQAETAARGAFTQAAPKASKPVADAATRKATDLALKDTTAKNARRGVTEAATETAKKTSTLAKGAGAPSRAAATTILKEGGEAAATAATKAVAKSALKTAAKAGARFVPGLNIGIAALDTANAAATWADPKANVGQKVTSSITAVGSVIAATNIPVVSQVGAAVSAVSSFIGSFF